MLTSWLLIRQAQEALRVGRYEDALRLAGRPELTGHKRASEIQQQAGWALVARARQHLRQADSSAAWKDLDSVAAAGLNDPQISKLRSEIIARKVEEIRETLENGDAARGVELASKLRERHVLDATLDALEEVARSWSLALELAAKGELAQAAAAVERLPRGPAGKFELLTELRRDLARRRAEIEPLLARLHAALEGSRWRDVIALADQVLAIAPQHAEARKARSRAWKAVEPPTLPVAAAPLRRAAEAPAADPDPARRLLLWIDGVGGYLICLSPRVSIGQAGAEATVDVPILADISRLHAYLSRDGEGYFLEALRPVQVNHKAVDRGLLCDGDRLTLGTSCQLRFRQPLPLSNTARLDLVSGHRLALSVDGVLLMGEACILGEAGQAHIEAPGLSRPIALVRRGEGLAVKAIGPLSVDGQPCRDKGILGPRSIVAAEDFRMALEPLGPNLGNGRR